MGQDHATSRAEIAELYSRYAWALNDRDWRAWEACFTPHATIDNTTAGGIVGTRQLRGFGAIRAPNLSKTWLWLPSDHNPV